MKKKILVVALAIAMLALAAVAGTMAWLHDNAAENFKVTTYGDVSIKMDVVDYADNELYLIPNGKYYFTPTVSVDTVPTDAVREDFYLRMFVTVTKADVLAGLAEIEKIEDTTIMDITKYIDKNTNWSLYKSVQTVDNKYIYEFRYTDTYVDGDAAAIDEVFNTFTLDKRLNDDDVEALQGLEFTFEAQAMQAVEQETFGTSAGRAYFLDHAAAWAEFDKQIGATAYNNPVAELVTDAQNGNVPYTPGATLQ